VTQDSGDPKSGEQDSESGTRIDLGDDLIEKTAMLVVPGERATLPRAPDSENAGGAGAAPIEPESEPERPRAFAPEEIEDQLQSARILLDEGLVEDAKLLLRRIVLSDSRESRARSMLAEVHEIEVRQLFGDEKERRSLRDKKTADRKLENVDAERVMRQLDHDLKLDLFAEEFADPIAPELSLFKDRSTLDAFCAKLERDFAGHAIDERVDLAVAFLEMGLCDVAARQVRALLTRIEGGELSAEPERERDAKVSLTSLLATACLRAGRAFDAAIALQPVLQDSEVPPERKLDLIYLMGRASEGLAKYGDAVAWYEHALELDDRYRDARERAARCAGIRSSSS
jgi:hypothetical protein